MPTRREIAAIIDHTLLKPEATAEQIDALLAQGARLGVLSVCVSPNQLPLEAPDGLRVATVCGFPSGAQAWPAAAPANRGGCRLQMP